MIALKLVVKSILCPNTTESYKRNEEVVLRENHEKDWFKSLVFRPHVTSEQWNCVVKNVARGYSCSTMWGAWTRRKGVKINCYHKLQALSPPQTKPVHQLKTPFIFKSMEINYHLQNERTNLIKDYNWEKRDLFNRNINLYFLHCCT